MTLKKAFGQVVAHARDCWGMSQAVLAKRAKLGRPAIWRIENGKVDTQLSSIVRIADALGVSAGSLIEKARGIKNLEGLK